MNPHELRALADAIVYRDSLAIARAADYLRACADAQPVRAVPIGHALSAVRHVGSANYPDRERAAIERLYSAEFDAYTHPAPAAPAGYKLVPVEPTPEMLAAARDWSIQKNGIAVGNDQATGCFQAMLAAAPAAPQAEPDDDKLVLGEPDILTPEDIRRLVPQAEPKREPLTARRILEIEDDAIRQWRDNGMIDDHAVVFARMIERAHGIGGGDE